MTNDECVFLAAQENRPWNLCPKKRKNTRRRIRFELRLQGMRRTLGRLFFLRQRVQQPILERQATGLTR